MMAYDFKDVYHENIVNLIEKPQVEHVKSSRYRSIHSKHIRIELSRARSAHKTLGLPQVHPIDPRDYLRKRSGLTRRQKSAPEATRHTHYRRPNYIHELPKWTRAAVPKLSTGLPDLPKDPVLTCRKNFAKDNVEFAKTLRPKTVNPRFVDTRRGDVHDLMASGLKPIFIYKKDFGKVPEMLKKRLVKDQRYATSGESDNKKSLCTYITEDERQTLLSKLKMKWEETMKVFNCLPFLIDTVAKIRRKMYLEEKLQELERDIGLIENHPYIYVYDDYNE